MFFLTRETGNTDRSPQSSHSNAGFHPKRLLHRSHLPTRSPVEKSISRGFQPVLFVVCAVGVSVLLLLV